jgi:PEP-CTERM motif
MRWMQRVINFINRDIRLRALRLFMVLLILGAVSGAAPSIKADPVVVGTWYEFQREPFCLGPFCPTASCTPSTTGPNCIPSPSGNGQFAPNPPWTFTLLGPGTITVTDVAQSGDAFDVFDFGIFIGSTPNVPIAGTICGGDPVPCSLDPLVSHAVFSLMAGPHSITIFERNGRCCVGYFRVDEVPEPTALLLLASGLGGGIGLARRKRKTTH